MSMDYKKTLEIGPRTRRNVLKGKSIRKLKDGADVFEDYWTDSDQGTIANSRRSIRSSAEPQTVLNADSSNHIIEKEHAPYNLDTPNARPQKTSRKKSEKLSIASALSKIVNKKAEMITPPKRNLRSTNDVHKSIDLLAPTKILSNDPSHATNVAEEENERGNTEKSPTIDAVNSPVKNKGKLANKSTFSMQKEKRKGTESKLRKKSKHMSVTSKLIHRSDHRHYAPLSHCTDRGTEAKKQLHLRTHVSLRKHFNVSSNNKSSSPEKSLANSNKHTPPNKHISVGKNKTSCHGSIPTNPLKHLHEEITEIHEFKNPFKQKRIKKRKMNAERKSRTDHENGLDQQNSLNVAHASESTYTSDNNKNMFSVQKEGKKRTKLKPCRKSKGMSETSEPVRRSSRQRYAPLAHWRNERLSYCFEKGNIKILGIDKGTEEDDAAIRQLYKRTHKPLEGKTLKPKKAKLIDTVENKKISIDLVKKFSLMPWNIPSGESDNKQCLYQAKRMFQTHKNVFGFLEIEVNKEKPQQYMPEDDIHLTVINGNLELNVQGNRYKLVEKDMVIIPRGSAYGIKNVGHKKALLSFALGKFKYLERYGSKTSLFGHL